MDFLSLLLWYLFIITVVLVVYCFSGSRAIRRSFTLLEDYVWPIFPGWCRDVVLAAVNWLLFERNPLYQALYCTFTAAGHVILFIEVLPFLYAMDPDTNHTFVPQLLLLLTVVFFALCSWTDPGLIGRENGKKYRDVYTFDNVVYKKETFCEECKMTRPARARHCVVCKKCVLRFDHHCLWTNSCVGFYNHRYFLCLLLAIILSGGYSVILSVKAMWFIIEHYKLLSAKYVDMNGEQQDMTVWTLVQHLFFQYPRVVMLISSVSVIVVMLAIFLIYHVHLILNNQTTYEKNKLTSLEYNGSNFYSQGVWRNIREVFKPSLRPSKKPKHRQR